VADNLDGESDFIYDQCLSLRFDRRDRCWYSNDLHHYRRLHYYPDIIQPLPFV